MALAAPYPHTIPGAGTPSRPADTAGRQRTLVHRIAALLLDYPDQDLLARLPSLRAATVGLDQPVRDLLGRTLDHLARTPALELAAGHVAAVTAHRHADLPAASGAYPEHLFLVLERAATTDLHTCTRLLVEHRAELELLYRALTDAGSPYADALAAVRATLPPEA